MMNIIIEYYPDGTVKRVEFQEVIETPIVVQPPIANVPWQPPIGWHTTWGKVGLTS